MVTKERFDGEEAFACDACELHYSERETAERCESFCRENGACNTEIIAQSLEQSSES